MSNSSCFIQTDKKSIFDQEDFFGNDYPGQHFSQNSSPSPVHLTLPLSQQMALSHELNMVINNLCQEKMPFKLADHAGQLLGKYFTPQDLVKIRLFYQTGVSPYLLVKNLVTTDNLPPTPTDDSVPELKGWRLQAAALLGLLRLCGLSPASFLDEMGGRLYHMVMPANNSPKSYIRSTKALNFHTEVVNGYFAEDQPEFGSPLSPGAFGLICFRNPDAIPTTVLPIDSLLNQLTDETIWALMNNNYTATSQSSFDREIVINNVPVLKLTAKGVLGMRYSHSKLTGQNAKAQKALLILKSAIESAQIVSLALQPGDALIINNRICLHGRAKVPRTNRLDGLNRWLVRIYGYDDVSMQHIKFDPTRKYTMIVDKES